MFASLSLKPNVARPDDVDWRALAEARSDTIAAIQWLLEDEREKALDQLAIAEDKTDSLTIELAWCNRSLAEQPDPPNPIWSALGSRPAVFIYGLVGGCVLAVQVMHAVD